MKVQIGFRLDDELDKKLELVAKVLRKKKTTLVREAVETYYEGSVEDVLGRYFEEMSRRARQLEAEDKK